MYNLLLADDDAITRRGLQSLKIWEKLGIRIIETVSDGLEALDALARLPVDILLTDVKMPRMDGLKLAEEAHRLYPYLSIVFVSGYDDVDYIRQALRLQAIDYILKPISPAELEQCFTQVLSRISEQKVHQAEVQKLLDSYKAGMSFIEENLLGILVTSDTIPEQQLQSVVKALNPSKADSIYFPVAVRTRFPDFPQQDTLSLLGDNIRCFVLDRNKGQFIVLFYPDHRTSSAERKSLASKLRDSIKATGAQRCICAYSDQDGSVWDIRALCANARSILDNSFCCPDGSVISNVDRLSTGSALPPRTGIAVEELERLVLSEKPDQLTQYIIQLFSDLKKTNFQNPGDFLPYLTPILQALDDLIRRRFTVEDDYPSSITALVNRLSDAFCLDDMRMTLLRHCEEIQDTLRSRPDSETALRINRVKQYILAHYSENLTLETIARQINLAPTYLCLLFREKTGQTMNAYITETRMEKARALLADLNLKLFDVSSAVGYPNPSYFTRLFRKHTGMTPTEYRNRCIKEVGYK